MAQTIIGGTTYVQRVRLGAPLLCLLLAGCLSEAAPQGQPLGSEGWRPLANGHLWANVDEAYVVLDDEASWREWWRAAHAGDEPAPELPRVDFTRHRVALATPGSQPNTCHDVAITNVTYDADAVAIHVTLTSPSPATGCFDAARAPYDAAVIWREPTSWAFERTQVARE